MSVRANSALKPADFGNASRETLSVGVNSIAPDKFPVDILADLTRTEVAAAHLGVDGDELKPIEFMNTGHYNELKKANSLSDTLVRRIEAFRQVAEDDQ